MTMFDFSSLRALPEPAAHELSKQHDAELQHLLPLLGPVFGLVVLLFGAWDYWIDASHAWLTVPLRALCVLIGSLAYMPNRLNWSVAQRCVYVYLTHVTPIIVSQFLLKDGFLYGLPGITASVFTVALLTLSLRTFLLILSLPTLLLVVLSALATPLLGFINIVMLYLFTVGMAGIALLVVRSFRQKAYLFERELLHMSHHDSLTGAYNRGYLTELAEREIALARRHGRALAVAMLDIDHFKHVNDNHGHAIGDLVIQQLAHTCADTLRVIDHFGRIGGEEFVCVLPETEQDEALQCAERLRLCLAALQVPTPQGPLQFTVSIGVAVLQPHHANWSALLKDADAALYRAKNSGRNRVVLAGRDDTIVAIPAATAPH